jgi:YHS domain-containing protein
MFKKIQFSLALGALSLVMLGCSDNGPAPTRAEVNTTATAPTNASAEGEPVAFTNAQGELWCPVMNVAMKSKEDAVGYQDYKGKRYYFCCAGCPERFKENPAAFAKK